MLSAKFIGLQALKTEVKSLSDNFGKNMRKGMNQAVNLVEGDVIDNLSGKVLNVRTDRLRSSLQKQIHRYGAWGKVKTGVVYARIHEFGGKTGRGHAVNIPKRPYMLPALEKNTKKIVEILGKAVFDIE